MGTETISKTIESLREELSSEMFDLAYITSFSFGGYEYLVHYDMKNANNKIRVQAFLDVSCRDVLIFRGSFFLVDLALDEEELTVKVIYQDFFQMELLVPFAGIFLNRMLNRILAWAEEHSKKVKIIEESLKEKTDET